jgi:hypothetical protein
VWPGEASSVVDGGETQAKEDDDDYEDASTSGRGESVKWPERDPRREAQAQAEHEAAQASIASRLVIFWKVRLARSHGRENERRWRIVD